ncbi:single-stranded DNA-binding protein [Vibrio sp. 10N.261.46.E12]|uniref:single-stranded DNA-binding protein n=2 Tax=Vibrio TaxID=662 RepID=UPI0009787E16|nr:MULTISPECIES: single-stranded DNA-binding protein [unclassified Vibrio]OMO36216.1 hypothetical protein BH584_05415 [Vibrio sp. 10N.261.45.E1]PMJ34432.1 hypothetical protein BCU27_03120 [Vibrio sp. 10N.286.45.B6]PML86803.1 hypothetical protein BCT66_00825 [Vibrio sp. 10N.261.49.E11]PMM76803.1 hypothetical protein BCT48_24700 [Vibrio sp. 10N.261.46.F12]PMN80497.1 hypothetical protein BCT25_15670 [Vibrio sp. 10N.261.45.A6]
MIKTSVNALTFGGTTGGDLQILGGQNGNKPFGVISIAQETSWRDETKTSGFNSRTTWMNCKFNDRLLDKIQRNGGFYKGDELVVEGQIVQRKGNNNQTYTEIQVDAIVSHTPKALKELARQSGFNQPAKPVSQPQQQQQGGWGQPQQPVNQRQPVQQSRPQHNAQPSQPQHNAQPSQPQHNAQPSQPQQQWQDPNQQDNIPYEDGGEFYGSVNQQ